MDIKIILIFENGGGGAHFWVWIFLDFFSIEKAVSTLVTNSCKKLKNLTGNNFECSLTKTFKSLKYVHTIKTCLNIINRNILHLKWIISQGDADRIGVDRGIYITYSLFVCCFLTFK
jgi:hypothetical protein